MSKWLLIDGFNLAYRAHYAMPELTRADGFPTNALHGWARTLWKLFDQEKPYAVAVFFDRGGAKDRLAILPEYKAQRSEMPEPLQKQIQPIKDLTRAMGLPSFEQEGVESDDILAAHATALAANGHDVLIVSADKDFAQLVNERIRILLPPPTNNTALGWRFLDSQGVVAKFGVSPEKIADMLAIVGDVSDNIPGLSGVGPKTATKWLNEHGSLENIIAAAGRINPDRFREAIAAQANDLRRNLKLTTLNTSLPAESFGPPQPDLKALLAFFELYEMRATAAEARQRYVQPELF